MALSTPRRSRHLTGTGGHPHGRRRVVRPALLAVAVFALTTVLGAALSTGTATERPSSTTDHRPVSELSSTRQQTAPVTDEGRPGRTVAHGLIYSGAGALLVSSVGMVMVARHRRRW